MARPLRLEFAGALYHVTSRGDRREDIFICDDDRRDWLDVLGATCERFNWVIHAWCQMTNHYHVLVETVDGNLSQGMRQLNGHYTQRFNRRHAMVGHLFQGRYKAILVQRDTYLLELSRYVVLNPLRARMVASLDDWPWSSFSYAVGTMTPQPWFDADWLLTQFGTRRPDAIRAYREFVMAGNGLPSLWCKPGINYCWITRPSSSAITMRYCRNRYVKCRRRIAVQRTTGVRSCLLPCASKKEKGDT